ncbi:MAG: BrnT family toxin [Elusimicrobiota bacterium]
MNFEFDERKSQSNKKKHGIDSTEAQVLWDDPELLEIPLKSADEPRTLLVGLMHIRIISVRRSRTEERDLYES